MSLRFWIILLVLCWLPVHHPCRGVAIFIDFAENEFGQSCISKPLSPLLLLHYLLIVKRNFF
jgi:hypothetical protein